jgi:hypothetical protein
MKPLLTRYRELLSLAQLYLHREYSRKESKTTDPKTFAHFYKKIGSPLPSLAKDYPKQAPLPIIQTLMPVPTPAANYSPLPSAKAAPRAQISTDLGTPTLAAKSENKAVLSQPPINQTQMGNFSPHTKNLPLEPLSSLGAQDVSEFWKLHRELFPDLPLSENVPGDSAALKVKNAWLNEQIIPPVVILSFRDCEKELAFLKNVAQAISLRLAKARVISVFKWEKENDWEKLLNSPNLRLIIATDYDLYLKPELMKLYREVPQQGKHYLNRTPLLLLSDLSLYLKEHQLKSLLWRAICNEFAISSYHRE